MRFKLKKGTSKELLVSTINNLATNRDWSIEIKQWRKKRSRAQDSYYWSAIVHPVALDTGNENEDIHQWLLGECFGWEEHNVMGNRRKRPVRSLTTPEPMTVEEMVGYCEWCAMRLANEGYIVDPPREIQV